jgi:two-component system response regulator BaeR
MKATILIVEDEAKLAKVMADYLEQAGFATHTIGDGMAVIPWIKAHEPQLVLLDLMLPGKGGLEICKDIRSFSPLPVVITTARIEEIDRLLGLELGADDYICKPYSPREVVARVKAVLRRSGAEDMRPEQGLILDEARYQAILDSHDLGLTAVEFKLLSLLAAKPGRIYGRQQLMDHIYTDQRIVSDRTIDSHIKKLRKKIAAVSPGKELIHSLYGVGYKFDPTDE